MSVSVTASASLALASVTPMLTTTFVPSATTCTENRLTMLANRGYQIWNNMPLPVPGTTFTDCYPSQYASSWLLSAGGVTQPAFNPLICPENYSAVGPYTSNYIACCPSGYSFAAPTVSAPSDRPAFGGTCYTPLFTATPVLVTYYGSSSVTATSSYTATATNAQAYAFPIDGYAYGVAQLASGSEASTTSSSASSTTTSSNKSSSSGTAPSNTSVSGTGASPTSSNSTQTFVPANSGNSLKIGLGVGLSAAAVLLLSLGIFCLRRKRRTSPADASLETSPVSKDASNCVYHSPNTWNQETKSPGVPPKTCNDAHEISDYQSKPYELPSYSSPTAPSELAGHNAAYELHGSSSR